MNFTAGIRKHRHLFVYSLLICLLLAPLAARAEVATTLTVQIKGVRYDGESGWRSVTLSGPVEVLSDEGALLGTVMAGALPDGEESDTLTLQGVNTVVLRPAQEQAPEGYVFAGESRAELTPGGGNVATVFAFAKQGLFTVRNVLAGTGEPLQGASFSVLDATGNAIDEFAMDETGLYTALQPLPIGEYTLTQALAADGVQPMATPLSFTLAPYFGREEDIVQLVVESEPVSSLSAVAQNASALSVEEDDAPTLAASQPQGGCEVSGAVNENGAPVSGVAVLLQTPSGARMEATTGADGAFAFTGAESGEAILRVTPPRGKAVTTADGEAVNAAGFYEKKLALSADAPARCDILLGRAAAIVGGACEAGGGQTVSAVSVYAHTSAQTAEDGSFRLDNLTAGDYSVYVPLPEGKLPSDGSPWRVTQQGDALWLTVSVEEGGEYELPALSFAAFSTVEGCAYVDANGNATREEGEQLLTGVPVTLQRAENGAWQDVAETRTDEYGQYRFAGLSAGEYRVLSRTDAESLYVASVGLSTQREAETGAVCGQALALASGQNSAGEADIGLQTPASLLLSAYVDANRDGARGADERAAANVRVELLDGQTAARTAVTDASGEARLSGLQPGAYTLRVNAPDGYALTKLATETGEGLDGAAAEGASLTLANGQSLSLSAGVVPAGSLSGKVFEDLNNNGVMDEGEPGVPGVTLRLQGKKTGATYELVTDETGEYRFSGLSADTYVIIAALPEGMLFARYSKTGGDLRSIFTGSTTSREFPVAGEQAVTGKNVGVIEKGVIAGTAFLDLNYNGIFDEGEPGYAGVTLEAIKLSNNESMGKTVSAEDGSYRIEGLRGGDYRLRAILPEGGAIFTLVPTGAQEHANRFEQRGTRRENSIQPVSIESGGEADTLVGVALGASVTGTVYQDADYNGSLNGKEKKLSGMKVQLANAAGEVVEIATTNAEGKYLLEGIMPGTYTVRFQRKAGYGFTRLRPAEKAGSHVTMLEGEYGVTAAMEIAMGQKLENINAGMLPASTVTGTLFHDMNDDGMRDENETGMTGAQVRLLSEDGEIDLTKTVGEDGAYFFDGVMPGRYTLCYLLPEHVEIARVAQDGNTLQGQGRETTTAAFVVNMGEAYQCPLVGAVELGSFSGHVFHDSNATGTPEEGEELMAGAEITFTPNRADVGALSVTSGADGSFVIDGLRPAQYQLTIKLPNGYIFSHDLDDDGLKLDTAQEQTLDCPWSALCNRTEKAIGAVKPASVAGQIWLDENKDGTQGDGEALMANVTVEMVSAADGRTVKRVASGAEGFLFENVRPGTYTVRFALPGQAEPAEDRASSFTADGAYMAAAEVAVKEGEAISGLTTGLVSRTSVGGRVWLEEGGEKLPVSGVTVKLYAGGATEPVQTAQTAEDGSYRFDGLWPDDYSLEASLPEGAIFVRPDDPNFAPGASVIATAGEGAGTSEPFYLQMAQHLLNQNIIYIKPAKVGDLAWLDENRNGLIDGGEPMIPGVSIRLVQNGQTMYETTTDAYGYYLFKNVYPGSYTLEATAYPELAITTPVPELRLISSCLVTGDGERAQSEPFSVESGSTNQNFDLGYVLGEGQSRPDAMITPPSRDWTTANRKE